MEVINENHHVNEDSRPEACSICANTFDQENRRPRCLPCCHSFCSLCIANMLSSECSISCPTCRKKHTAADINQFPVNFSLEGLVQKLKGICNSKGTQILTDNNKLNRNNCPGIKNESNNGSQPESGMDKLHLLFQEQLNTLKRLPLTYQESGVEIDKRLDQLRDLIKTHENKVTWIIKSAYSESLLKVAQDNNDILRQLEERKHKLLTICQEAEVELTEVDSVIDSLTSSPTPQNVILSIKECDKHIKAREDWWKRCQEILRSDEKVIRESQKLLARTRDGLMVATLTDDIMNLRNPSSTTLQVNDLLKMTNNTRSLLQTGQVFALKQTEDGLRYAKVSFGGKHLYIHHLKKESPSHEATILPYNEVYSLVDGDPSLAFLDLGVNMRHKGRLLIRLLRAESPRAKQFVILCTAIQGPTYANTSILCVGNKGLPTEFVRGGDYEYNNGYGGASLLPDLSRGGVYWKQQVCGSVSGAGSWEEACSSQFFINTRNPGFGLRDDTIYGQVEEGLEVLNSSIKDSSITNLNVIDCGIVIPL